MKIVDGYYVMVWLGGRYGSCGWYKDQSEAMRVVQYKLIAGLWSGMPPKVEPSFRTLLSKEMNP